MSLSDRLEAPQSARPCVVAQTIAAMPEADRTAALDALAGDKETEAIAHAMTAEGYRVAPTSLRRHRTGRCCCGVA